MVIGGSIETTGKNLEFGVGTAGTEVTIYFTGGSTGDKTSSDDTETEKYTDSYGRVKYYQIRSDQAIQLLSINGNTFTDPISVTKNTGITEKLDTPLIIKMTLRTTTDNTNVKIRVR